MGGRFKLCVNSTSKKCHQRTWHKVAGNPVEIASWELPLEKEDSGVDRADIVALHHTSGPARAHGKYIWGKGGMA